MASRRRRPVSVEYTARAQRQDAENAMGSDPIRAIIELVTNADDAYARDGYQGDASILIRVQRRRERPHVIEILDRASGMSTEQVEQRLARAGGRNSGFEAGQDVRGLLGRGAKDVAHFGPVQWVTVRDELLTTFSLDLTSPDDATGWIEGPERPADKRSRRSGTAVTMEVQKRFSLPMPDKLRSNLTRHYALRPILRNRRGRDVKLDTGSGAKKLTYHEPSGDLLEDSTVVPIDGYAGQTATITLSRAPESIDDGEDREYWHHSLLIQSGSAAYDVFSAGRYRSGHHASLLGHFFGTVDVPGISELIREHDRLEELREEPPPSNPIRLIKRDRSGLVARRDHPFVDALYKAIEQVLEPHVERLRKELQSAAGQNVGEELQRRLNEAGRVISKYLRDEVASEGGGQDGSNPPLGLSIVPSTRIVLPSTRASVTVRYRSRDVQQTPVARVSYQEFDQEDPRTGTLVLEQRTNGYFSKSIRLEPRPDGSTTGLTVSLDNDAVSGEVRWEETDADSVDRLQFEHAHNTVGEGGLRRLRLLAPFDLIEDEDDPPTVTISGASSITMPESPTVFRADLRRQCLVSVITVRGQGLGSKAKLTALAAGEPADAHIEVRSAGVAGFVPKIEEHDNDLRAWMVPEEGKIVLNAKHPALSRYVGHGLDGWPVQNSAPFKSMLAELISATAVRSVLTARHRQPLDVNDLLHEYETHFSKLVPQLHRALVTEAELRVASA